MNDPPSSSDERLQSILAFEKALYAQFEAEDNERTKLDMKNLDFFDANKVPADPSGPAFLEVTEEVEQTDVSNQQPEEPVRLEMTNFDVPNLSSQFVPKQGVKPIKALNVSFPVECDYLKLSTGLEEKSTNWLRLGAQPFRNDGDIVALMINLFGTDLADIKAATIPAILVKIVGLTQSILGGARLVALGENVNIFHDKMRRPLGSNAPPNALLKPNELSDRAWGLILTAMLPSCDIHTEHPDDRRFMAAFFRHDIPGLADIITNGEGYPIGPSCSGENVAHEVESWLNKTFGHKLIRKIQNTVCALSTVYGPVRCPGNDPSRYYKAQGTRQVLVNWAAPVGGAIPQPDGVGAALPLPGITAPAPGLDHWNFENDWNDRTREYRLDALVGAAGEIDLRPYMQQALNAAFVGGQIMRLERQFGVPHSAYDGAAQVAGLIHIVWADPLGNAPAGTPNPLPVAFDPVGNIPAFAMNWARLYRRIADFLTGYPRNRAQNVSSMAGYVPPCATRNEGVRDCYGLIDRYSVHHVPVMESRMVGAILSGFMRMTRTGERGKWGAKTRAERISDVNYRGRQLHYLFNSVRYAFQQDPAQTDDTLFDGRLLTERFKDPVSSYTGPYRMDRDTDPGPSIECLESPLIMRTRGVYDNAMRFTGGHFEFQVSGSTTRVRVRGNNRKALDSAMRAYGMQGDGAAITVEYAPATPALMVQLNAVGAGQPGYSHVAPFSLPTRIRSAQDNAVVNMKIRCAPLARRYFMGDTERIAERIM